jgi:hypothetical protein
MPRVARQVPKDGDAASNWREREAFTIIRLAQADGVIYDDLIREVMAAFPVPGNRVLCGIRVVRTVRGLLWKELAVTESDESVWLTPAGWGLLEDRQPQKASAS